MSYRDDRTSLYQRNSVRSSRYSRGRIVRAKISLRSNEYTDVSAIAKLWGGGGHLRAAGLTIRETPEIAEKQLIEAIKTVI